MSTRAATISFSLLTLGYVGALVWLESRLDLRGLGQLTGALPVMLSLAAVGWLARLARWWWLLRRSGHRLAWRATALAYVAGFAFTATPGKVGELVRIRYFAAYGVPARKVLSAFVYERVWDLVIVLLLAAAAFRHPQLLRSAALFAATIVLAVAVVASRPGLLTGAVVRLRRAGLARTSRLLRVLRDGLAGCRQWLHPLDLLVSAVLGVCAWSTTSLALVWLVHNMGFSLPAGQVFAIYPLAMLVGAVSMLPGGVGTTEATIAAQLATAGVPWEVGAVIALGARLATLWFAVALGLLAVSRLEYRPHRVDTQARSTE